MKNRLVIDVRVRYGKHIILHADSDQLWCIARYGGYRATNDGFMEILGVIDTDPNYHLEIKPVEIPNNKYRAVLRRLRRRIHGKKPKTSTL